MTDDRDAFDEMDLNLGPQPEWPPYGDGGAEAKPKKRRSKAAPTRNDIVTEDSAACEFAELYGDRLRFCHDTGAWFEWTGVAWRQNRVGMAFQWARELVRRLIVNEDADFRFKASKTSFAAGVERFARSDPAFAVTAEAWDADPWLLGTPGGTVDLRTGVLREALQAERITKLTAVAPARLPDCPLWLAFLSQATGGDEGLIRFLRQWCGYALTGTVSEHALVFVYGPGGNGKSVFLNVVTGILAEYAKIAAMDTFTASKGDKHPTDMAMLRGARLVTASETEEDRAWAEAKIKQLTGGDPVTARFMRQDFFTFTPTFKLMIVGNHQPLLRNVDDAARRRFNIVPFTRKPERPDTQLEHKLKAEWPAILRWMIEGCLDWQQNGLVRPASVTEATEAYFAEQDLMGQWLAERCELRPGETRVWERSADLFESWSDYARAAGDVPGTLKSFTPALRRKGLVPYRTEYGRGFRGIRLKPYDGGGMTHDG
ncbi:phage/plasmid primase, P4 family [Methylobacterium sp. JK268]